MRSSCRSGIGKQYGSGQQKRDGWRRGYWTNICRIFRRRNPTLRVFSAHLHMDEATPHLHIDFVPHTTGSKRGLDTRVSLKQALSALGFKGGTRSGDRIKSVGGG